jgi:hypothetical protein
MTECSSAVEGNERRTVIQAHSNGHVRKLEIPGAEGTQGDILALCLHSTHGSMTGL